MSADINQAQNSNLYGRPARIATVERNTAETQIACTVNLDGTGQGVVDTGVPFLDHMIDQIKRHGLFDLDIKCVGDTYIDDHHSVVLLWAKRLTKLWAIKKASAVTDIFMRRLMSR